MSSSNSIRKPWTLAEDMTLIELVKEHGTTGWPTITMSMKSRTGKQCRERYINHLDPEMKKSAWTAEENDVIRDMFPEFGTKWSLYMPYLPGRSDNAIKNRYHTISRNNFTSCSTELPVSRLVVSHKRAKPSNGSSSDDTDADTNGTGETALDTNEDRLKKLLAARIVLDLEILHLEQQFQQDEEASLTSSPSSSSNAQYLLVQTEVPAGECFDADFDFDFEWTNHSDTVLTWEQAGEVHPEYNPKLEEP